MSTSVIHPTEALLTAIAAALRADAALITLCESGRGEDLTQAPVYAGAAPPDEPCPFLTFNDASDRDWNVSEAFGREILIDVHCHNDRQGQSGGAALGAEMLTRRILRRAELLLRDAALVMADVNLVYLRPAAIRVVPADGSMRHGTLTLRALIEEL